jgi:hypothetical protein
MAKRYSSKKGRKIEPSVQTLVFSTTPTTGGTTGEFTIDLSQCASLINRRFYRQGINWAVAGIKVITAGTGSIVIKKLPNSWVMGNAWKKSFANWQKMNREALQEAESVAPKFLDFKVYADDVHHTAGFGANLLPLGGTYAPAAAGEWVASKFVIPDSSNPGNSTEREVVAVGGSFPGNGASGFNAVSMIEGYAASRGLPYQEDPNAPADAGDAKGSQPQNWMSALFNDGTSQDDAVLDDMISENNQAPYPFEGDGTNTDTMYPGGANQLVGLQIHDWESISGTTIGGITRCKGGNFPCGLMRFDWTPENTSNIVIQVDLIPGNHRGYLCEPMGDM